MAKKATTDQRVLDLIKDVQRRKAEISKAERGKWLTNLCFSYNEDNKSGAVNVQVVSNVKDLITMAAFLMERERSYNDAAAVLGIDDPAPFTWCTFPVKDWLEDFRTRVGKIQIASKKRKLGELEARLNSIVSPELRAQMELEAIASELE